MFMAVLIVLLVPVLGSVAVALSDDMAYIWGMAVGERWTCPGHWHISENNEEYRTPLWCWTHDVVRPNSVERSR